MKNNFGKVTILSLALSSILGTVNSEELIIANNKDNREKYSGTIYTDNISGDINVTFLAEDVGYDENRRIDDIVLEDGRVVNEGNDDRYGRHIELHGENDFKGTVNVGNLVQLAIGNGISGSMESNVLGTNNDLNIEGFTEVTIRSKEEVNKLVFNANDHSPLYKDDNDPDDMFYPQGTIYGIYNQPNGGVIHLTNDTKLKVNDELDMNGSDEYNVKINSHGAELHVVGNTTLDQGSVDLQNNSHGSFDSHVNITGHGSGINLYNDSIGHVGGHLTIDVKDGQQAYLTSQSGSDFNIGGNANIKNGTINVTDGNGLYNPSRYNEYDGDDYENQTIDGSGLRYQNSSLFRVGGNLDMGQGTNEINLIGSRMEVGGNIKANNLKNFFLGSELRSNAIDFGNNQVGTILDSKILASNLAIGNESDIFMSASDITLGGNMSVGNDSNILDSSLSGEDNRMSFKGDHAHHGLTYEEMRSVTSGYDSVYRLNGDEDRVYNIDHPNNITIGGSYSQGNRSNLILKGDSNIGGAFSLGEGSIYHMMGGDTNVGWGGDINGTLIVDDGKAFTNNNASLIINTNQDQIHGTLKADGNSKLILNGNNVTNGTVEVGDKAQLIVNGDSNVYNLVNSGIIKIGSANTGNKHSALVVNNDFYIHDGTIQFGDINVVANEDNPLESGDNKDLLLVKGDAYGMGRVEIIGSLKNVGELTKKGILLVNVDGKSELDLTMTGNKPIMDGGTEYVLVGRTDIDSMNPGKNSWYLSNTKEVIPAIPLEPPFIKEPEVEEIPAIPLEPSNPIEEDKEELPLIPLEPPVTTEPENGKDDNDIDDNTSEPEVGDSCNVRSFGFCPIPQEPEVEVPDVEEPSTPQEPEIEDVNEGEGELESGDNDDDSNKETETETPSEKQPPQVEDVEGDKVKDNDQSTNDEVIVAPVVGTYLANMVASNEMFNLKYSDRNYVDDYDGVWVRIKGSQSKFGLGDVSSKLNTATIHIGKDLYHNNDWTLGIMGAYGHTSSKSINSYTGSRDKVTGNGFAIGGYASKTYNDEHGYIDSWIQYVNMSNKAMETSYKSKGLIASIETGYNFDLNGDFKLLPMAQVTWSNVKMDNHYNGRTKVSGNSGNIQTRVGSRIYNDGSTYKPYAEVNYIHNTKPYKVNMDGEMNSNSFTMKGNKNIFNIELGVNAKINRDWVIDGSIGYSKGSDSYKEKSVKLNIRYNF